MGFMQSRFQKFLFLVVAVSISTTCFAKGLHGGMNTIYIPKVFNGITSLKSIPVDIYVPSGDVRATLLVLPGWNYSRQRWHRETDLLKFADKYGFRCVFPEMGKSNYESKFFKESYPRPLWGKKLSGGAWIHKIFIPSGIV